MKPVIKNTLALIFAGVVASAALADQPVLALSSNSAVKSDATGPTLSRSNFRTASNQFTIDFMAGDEAVTAFNFDIRVSVKSERAVDIKGCTSGLQQAGFVGQCAYKNGLVKVVGFSPSAESLSTLTIGTIGIVGSAEIVASSVVMAGAQGQAIQAEIL